MKTTTVTLDNLEILVELARYGLMQHQQYLDDLQPPDDVNERNEHVALMACINRGMRAVDNAERKVIFS